MDNSDYSRNRHNEHLGVNRLGKNIKKSPLHQPNFANTARPQPQPQVYNINKNDFRSVVQQLTGSPSRSQEPPPKPPNNSPKPPSMRLQRIRPPPLTSMNRPQLPFQPPPPQVDPRHHQPGQLGPYNNSFARPNQAGQQPHSNLRPTGPPAVISGDSTWANTAESPISAYMRYLQNSIIDSDPRQSQTQQQVQQHPHGPNQFQGQPQSSGLLPYPLVPPLPSPRMNGFPAPPLPSPRMDGLPPLPSPRMIHPPLPSPRMNGPAALLPSPTSQFLLPSPTSYLNLVSPRSPYPLLSPGNQHPPPMTPNFSFSQSGILGPGPQPPPSPGLGFPLSPSGFLPFPSPQWRGF